MNISFLSLFLFSHGLKSELEEISQKFNFMLKGTVLGKFLKAFRALNERPPRNVMKQFINGGFQKCNFSSRGPPLYSEIWKIHLNVQVSWGNEMAWGKIFSEALEKIPI